MKIKTEELDNGNLTINSEFAELLKSNGITTAEKLFNIESDTVKAIVKERGTSRAFLQDGDSSVEVFIKRYSPVPLKEKLKLKLFRKPATADAYDEWRAINIFHENDLNTMVPIAVAKFGDKTCNLTLGIQDYVRASELFESFTEKDSERKKNLLKNIAELSGQMHALKLAHQDLYLVHLFVRESENDAVYLIDLQRTIVQNKMDRRWHVKDLGQLLFSAKPFLCDDDISYFWDIYTGITGLDLKNDKSFIKSVKAKAERIKKRDQRKVAKRKK